MSNLSLNELLAQKAALESQIAERMRTERAEAIAQVRALMAQYGLTAADIANKPAAPAKRSGGGGSKVAAKYRDPATGDSWSGRGLKPKWLSAALASGRTLADFAI